jgi:large subunit ribosomal protein L4e
MKLKIINATGNAVGEIDMPMQFNDPVRADLIKKAVLAIQNNNRQPYGSFEDAGDRHAVRLSKRRRDYKTPYGKGISRTPRKTMSRRGSQMHWVGAQAPNTVGGRRAHPPKACKVWDWKINDSERRKAIRSALSATMIKELVISRGHRVPDNYPFIIDDSLEKIKRTKELFLALSKLGFGDDLERTADTGIRSGQGKLRGRRKKSKKSLLIVVDGKCDLLFAAKNLPGVDVFDIKKLNAEVLAPGTHFGRATLFTTKAITELNKGLFTNHYNQDNNDNKVVKTGADAKPSQAQKVKTTVPAKTSTGAKQLKKVE